MVRVGVAENQTEITYRNEKDNQVTVQVHKGSDSKEIKAVVFSEGVVAKIQKAKSRK